MLAPPLGSWRPLLGEILDPPLLMETVSRAYSPFRFFIATLVSFFSKGDPKKTQNTGLAPLNEGCHLQRVLGF